MNEQLEKWNKVRESLYSQNGWCSTNVSQISKWDVGDVDNSLAHNNFQQHSHETGTILWNANLSQHQSCPNVPDSDCVAAPQLTEWKSKGAIPKMFMQNLNSLTMNATNYEFPHDSSGYAPQLDANVFDKCDSSKSTIGTDDDAYLMLHLQVQQMNLNEKSPEQMSERHAASQSLYSQNDWCTNVSQISKWDVDDVDDSLLYNTIQNLVDKTGTVIWNKNASQQRNKSHSPNVPDSECVTTPPLAEWSSKGAVPKMLIQNSIGLTVNATNYDAPQFDANAFDQCDSCDGGIHCHNCAKSQIKVFTGKGYIPSDFRLSN